MCPRVAIVSWIAFFAFVVPAFAATETTNPPATDAAGFYAAEDGLNPSERAGREIWYKATAGNDRFHTYVFQQRLGVQIDWYRVLRSDQRDDRFRAWGLINDPACCQPGSPGCPAKSHEETYGFDWCAGDEALLGYVGREGYRDPACDFRDAPLAGGDPHGPADQREDSCNLKFGTSTGAMGLRKFPNPRFDEAKWRALNDGDLGSWAGYDKKLPDGKSKLLDASVEPPFRIGMACGACHIAFDPTNPPDDPTNPGWDNLNGLVGNQYGRFSEIMASGMSTHSLEWQMFSHARPGSTDTSAVPNDQVNNPGTMNAILHTAERPTFGDELVPRWRKTDSCGADEPEGDCWCEPGRDNKCWRLAEAPETVHHILKGGGDSNGALAAIQRVYFNIGSCSEQCWVNHLTDLRQLDPQQRNFGQSPFEIGQCRRDCPEFRAMEDRLHNVLDFFLSKKGHVADFRAARENALRKSEPDARYTQEDLVEDLEIEFGDGAVATGRRVFGETCARCHSSQENPSAATDFLAVNAETGIRDDWMGNDRSTPATEVGTYRCRALHSNHMEGHVWEQFGSTSYRAKADVAGIEEPSDGGRGYYRNISLLNAWAHAPFMHNNAMGPEICGQPAQRENDFYDSPYVDADLRPLGEQGEACWPYDPSVDGRFELYKASMAALLNPDQRPPKVTTLAEDIELDLELNIREGSDGKALAGFQIRIPKGTPVGRLGNFQHKAFVVDLVQSRTKPKALEARLTDTLGDDLAKRTVADLSALTKAFAKNPEDAVEIMAGRPDLLELYMSCTEDVENAGHRFGEDLSDQDKAALTAFLATL
jgi:hypothetical protein